MIAFGTLSITLLIGAFQGVVLALMLLSAPANRIANRFLALLILAVAAMVTPYIIGFAGFYDAYPWLSFAPFGTGLAFGPLFYFYGLTLTGGSLPPRWRLHFAPYAGQFLAQALIFPLPLATKNWWDGFAYAPVIAPALTVASLVSVAIYGGLAWRRHQAYRVFLEANRTDAVVFDPTWIRNALLAMSAMAVVWSGFFLADVIDPSRNYFDRFWMYVGLCLLAIYLGVEGWRNARLNYPVFEPGPGGAPQTIPQGEAAPQRDWAAQAAAWAREVDARELWRDPDITLASLAKSLGTNTTYMSRALNEGLGVTFSAFINGRRVEVVKRQLADPSVTADILAIAFAAGFNSKASFNRAFAEITGTTPSAFRRAARLKA
jgi:AraC-like DNA-binding protein